MERGSSEGSEQAPGEALEQGASADLLATDLLSGGRALPPAAGRLRRARLRFLRGIPGFIVRRLLLGALTLFITSIVIFAATQALPGNPAQLILGQGATPESLAALSEQLGLNQPVVEQYTGWLAGLLTGDLGTSLGSGETVTAILGDRVLNSAFLISVAAVVSFPIAIFLGVLAARRRDGPLDHALSVVMLAFVALPEFVVGIALIIVFGTTFFHLLPPISLIPPGANPWDYPEALVLPVITLAVGVMPYTARILRASMVDALESDYVEMARLKGLRERKVVWRHALPNAIAPTIQVIALNLAFLAGGIVVVEFIFSYPGIGVAFIDAVGSRDIPVVQALAVMIAGLYVVLNLIADIATILVTPRVRTALR